MVINQNVDRMIVQEKENFIMKKTLLGLFTLVALALSIQVSQAACSCNSCATPCCTPCAAAPCTTAPSCGCGCNKCSDSCCGACCNACKKKCTWWKIFEDKTCCYKCNNECDSCYSAKRAHWYKFWTDRCVVRNVKCDDCGNPCPCPCEN